MVLRANGVLLTRPRLPYFEKEKDKKGPKRKPRPIVKVPIGGRRCIRVGGCGGGLGGRGRGGSEGGGVRRGLSADPGKALRGLPQYCPAQLLLCEAFLASDVNAKGL